MRTMLFLLLLGTAALTSGSAKYYENVVKETVIQENGIKSTYYDPAKHKEFSNISASYEIGAFKPEKGKYGMNCYDANKSTQFLSLIQDKFKVGDIVEVDGLKWKKMDWGNGEVCFEPHANPPEPEWDKTQEHLGQHLHDYAKWINDHPHLGYPPLPIDPEEL